VNVWVTSGLTPALFAVTCRTYVPSSPASGVPLRTPLLKVTLAGGESRALMENVEAAAVPVVVIVKEPAESTLKKVWLALVMP